MSSSEEENNHQNTVRRTHKLTLDSDEEERQKEEERREAEENRLRKEEKRRRREEAEREAEQREEQKKQKAIKYNQPEAMLDEDSNSSASFSRVEEKVMKAYPAFRRKDDHKKRRRDEFIDDLSSELSSDQADSDQNSSSSKKQKKKPIQKKHRRHEDEEQHVKKSSKNREKVRKDVKIEADEDPKENLVKEIAVRWWYVLPEWPPQHFNYEEQLNKRGYRIVSNDKFRLEQDLVNGLYKVEPVDGYPGVYKSKLGLVDGRPKESAPTLNFFRNKDIKELSLMVRNALQKQIQDLKAVRYIQCGEKELMVELERKLLAIKG